MEISMIEIGFWCKGDDAGDSRPHPASLQDKEWYRMNEDIAKKCILFTRYGGCIESYEMGYSYCRIDPMCPSKLMGACTLTDGIYCWPEGYVHYLETHHVKPPEEFIQHILLQEVPGPRRSKLFMWDYELNAPVPMPTTMQDMILKNTTITLDDSSDTCTIL